MIYTASDVFLIPPKYSTEQRKAGALVTIPTLFSFPSLLIRSIAILFICLSSQPNHIHLPTIYTRTLLLDLIFPTTYLHYHHSTIHCVA